MQDQALNRFKHHLGYLAPRFVEVVKANHTEAELSDTLWDLYLEAASHEVLSPAELQARVETIHREHLPHLTYSQVRKRMFLAMGYRSPVMANKMRQVYSDRLRSTELLCPSLWLHFQNVPFVDSVYAHQEGRQHPFLFAYLDMLFEPVINRQLDPQAITDPQHHQALGIVLYLARQKTVDERSLREQAEYLQVILTCGHHTALNIVALAMGYNTWTAMKPHFIDYTITNRRYKWRPGVVSRETTQLGVD